MAENNESSTFEGQGAVPMEVLGDASPVSLGDVALTGVDHKPAIVPADEAAYALNMDTEVYLQG